MVVANWPIRARDLLLLCYNSCYWSFLFHLCFILYNFLVCILYTFEFVCYLHVLCCICKIYLLAMSGFNVRLVNVYFRSSSLVCLAWVVFSDHFVTKSRHYQTKIFAGLVICVLATSLLVLQEQWIIINVIFFSHTYSSLQSSIIVQDKKNNDDFMIF